MTQHKFFSQSIAFLLVISALLLSSGSFAQQQSADAGVEYSQHKHDLFSITSNDYWVAFPSNYDGENDGDKFIRIYISSADSTTAFIGGNGLTPVALPIVPGFTATYTVPLSWEIETSDSVENKALHIWSDDASLFVDFDSHDAYTSDASNVFPSAGWGQHYLVASYESLNEEEGAYYYDYPSEFVIVADQDSTNVTIIPANALRSNAGVHPAGMPFTISMNAGQSVQYQVVKVTSDSVYDATGTQILSSKPVGVIGASSCANIPTGFPYCDFVTEMLPPVLTWGQTYYTAPLYGRTGGDTYLVIGTQPDQTITRTDITGTHTFATLMNGFDHAWQHDIATPSSWTSNAPFLLMQYSNSSTWPKGVNGLYDPFMMGVNSVDQFSTPVIFNILENSMGLTPFWHADIVAHSGVPVILNGDTVTAPAIYDDGICAVYRIDSLGHEQYTAWSDSGLSVSVYGDGFDGAVGYTGMQGVSVLNSLDTVSPGIAAKPVTPLRTTILATEVGTSATGLSEFEIDTLSNMQFVRSPNFVDGSGAANASFDLAVIDATKPAHAHIRVIDRAGNYSTVIKDYAANASASVANPTQQSLQIPSPNPANAQVIIPFTLQKNSHVSIDLYDVLGKLELSVLNADETAGVHSLPVDVRLLPEGTYVYRLESSEGVSSGRISIQR